MFAIGLGTVVLGVMPQFNQIQTIEATRAQAREENVAKLLVLADLKLKAADKSTLMAALEKKRQLVPSSLSIVEVMDELRLITSKRGVTIEKLSSSQPQTFVPPSPVKPNPVYDSAVLSLGSNSLFVSDLTFSLQGPMPQIAGVLEDISNGRRYVLISRVTVPKVESLTSGPVMADFTAQVFTLKAQ
jgi:hypothetical protein